MGLFGFREWRSIFKVRKKTEKDLNLLRHLSAAEMYLRNGMNTAASKEFEEVIKIDPNNLHAHMSLGFLYTDIYKDKAIEHCKRAIELDRNVFAPYLNWGVNLDHTSAPKEDVAKVYEEAEKVGEAQRVDDVSMGKLKRFLAETYLAIGNKGVALNKFKESKIRLEEAKKTDIPDVIKAADHWLRDLDSKIKNLET